MIKDPMTTASAIDWLVHHSVILELNSTSYRLEQESGPRRGWLPLGVFDTVGCPGTSIGVKMRGRAARPFLKPAPLSRHISATGVMRQLGVIGIFTGNADGAFSEWPTIRSKAAVGGRKRVYPGRSDPHLVPPPNFFEPDLTWELRSIGGSETGERPSAA